MKVKMFNLAVKCIGCGCWCSPVMFFWLSQNNMTGFEVIKYLFTSQGPNSSFASPRSLGTNSGRSASGEANKHYTQQRRMKNVNLNLMFPGEGGKTCRQRKMMCGVLGLSEREQKTQHDVKVKTVFFACFPFKGGWKICLIFILQRVR